MSATVARCGDPFVAGEADGAAAAVRPGRRGGVGQDQLARQDVPRRHQQPPAPRLLQHRVHTAFHLLVLNAAGDVEVDRGGGRLWFQLQTHLS